MEECPFCHYSLENTDKFCRSCGANLAMPEFERAFCPQCGVRVLTRQWYCQQCQWPLEKGLEKEEEESTFTAPTAARETGSRRKNTWIIGGLLGAGLVLIGMLAWFHRETPLAPPSISPMTKSGGIPDRDSSPMPLNPLPSLPKSTTAGPPADGSKEILYQHLTEVLSNLQEALMKKDISLYMKYFADSFPSRESKRLKALMAWKIYDYTALQYRLERVNPLDRNTVVAQVRGNIETRNQANQVNEKFTKSYKVWFSRTDEGWRIKNLEESPSP